MPLIQSTNITNNTIYLLYQQDQTGMINNKKNYSNTLSAKNLLPYHPTVSRSQNPSTHEEITHKH